MVVDRTDLNPTIQAQADQWLKELIPKEWVKIELANGMNFKDYLQWWNQQMTRPEPLGYHTGLDIVMGVDAQGKRSTLPVGTKVKAKFAGTVLTTFQDEMQQTVFVQTKYRDWNGNFLVIQYTHVALDAEVRPGTKVSRGQRLGTVKKSRNPRGTVQSHPHLGMAWMNRRAMRKVKAVVKNWENNQSTSDTGAARRKDVIWSELDKVAARYFDYAPPVNLFSKDKRKIFSRWYPQDQIVIVHPTKKPPIYKIKQAVGVPDPGIPIVDLRIDHWRKRILYVPYIDQTHAVITPDEHIYRQLVEINQAEGKGWMVVHYKGEASLQNKLATGRQAREWMETPLLRVDELSPASRDQLSQEGLWSIGDLVFQTSEGEPLPDWIQSKFGQDFDEAHLRQMVQSKRAVEKYIPPSSLLYHILTFAPVFFVLSGFFGLFGVSKEKLLAWLKGVGWASLYFERNLIFWMVGRWAPAALIGWMVLFVGSHLLLAPHSADPHLARAPPLSSAVNHVLIFLLYLVTVQTLPPSLHFLPFVVHLVNDAFLFWPGLWSVFRRQPFAKTIHEVLRVPLRKSVFSVETHLRWYLRWYLRGSGIFNALWEKLRPWRRPALAGLVGVISIVAVLAFVLPGISSSRELSLTILAGGTVGLASLFTYTGSTSSGDIWGNLYGTLGIVPNADPVRGATGFIVHETQDDIDVVTNDHVFRFLPNPRPALFHVIFPTGDQMTLDGLVLDADRTKDLAVVRFAKKDLPKNIPLREIPIAGQEAVNALQEDDPVYVHWTLYRKSLVGTTPEFVEIRRTPAKFKELLGSRFYIQTIFGTGASGSPVTNSQGGLIGVYHARGINKEGYETDGVVLPAKWVREFLTKNKIPFSQLLTPRTKARLDWFQTTKLGRRLFGDETKLSEQVWGRVVLGPGLEMVLYQWIPLLLMLVLRAGLEKMGLTGFWLGVLMSGVIISYLVRTSGLQFALDHEESSKARFAFRFVAGILLGLPTVLPVLLDLWFPLPVSPWLQLVVSRQTWIGPLASYLIHGFHNATTLEKWDGFWSKMRDRLKRFSDGSWVRTYVRTWLWWGLFSYKEIPIYTPPNLPAGKAGLPSSRMAGQLSQLSSVLAGAPLKGGLKEILGVVGENPPLAVALQESPVLEGAQGDVVFLFAASTGRLGELAKSFSRSRRTLVVADTEQVANQMRGKVNSRLVHVVVGVGGDVFDGRQVELRQLEVHVQQSPTVPPDFKRILREDGRVNVVFSDKGALVNFEGLTSGSVFRHEKTIYLWVNQFLSLLRALTAPTLQNAWDSVRPTAKAA